MSSFSFRKKSVAEASAADAVKTCGVYLMILVR